MLAEAPTRKVGRALRAGAVAGPPVVVQAQGVPEGPICDHEDIAGVDDVIVVHFGPRGGGPS